MSIMAPEFTGTMTRNQSGNAKTGACPTLFHIVCTSVYSIIKCSKECPYVQEEVLQRIMPMCPNCVKETHSDLVSPQT